MHTKELINRVVSIRLKNKALLEGIVIDVSEDWYYLKYIAVDYVMDGFVLINRRYINQVEIPDDSGFKENIMRLKGSIDGESPSLNIDSHVNLLLDLQFKKKMIKLELKNPDKCYIGKINLVREHSIKVHLFSWNAKWLGVESFLFKEIRAIYFDNDYIDSLQLALPVISDSE
ncbi:hypothetical protein C1637_13030 [Chryseobacterium lactis]|uniref:Uncharacterized protein n=1 Tax=Chryseobacterium lactis TaxID=1241981 RepID=A0A3G6RP09_CHRLC|nr:hypothetical protein [Chryseobacterium lactis]AZA80561.1 hypothetical protein EG342_00910 [Chryseobacterium lactis]AZB05563.1 hypothetical protein EG341_17035 [Chryseobacterium lactis]PNW13718.1 hypothetical protein C1637_13030 [Chryseobacterium lactis]